MESAMNDKLFHLIAGTIFALVALLHVLRIYMGWSVVVGGWSAPMWVSWIGLVVAGGLAYFALRGPRIIAVACNCGHLCGEQHRIETRTKRNHWRVNSGRVTIRGNYSRSPYKSSPCIRGAPQDIELVAKRQDLDFQRSSRSEQSDQSAKIAHRAKASPDSQFLTSRFWFPVG